MTNLKQLIKSRGTSLTFLSAKLGVHRNTISMIVRNPGSLTVRRAREISAIIGVPPQSILTAATTDDILNKKKQHEKNTGI